MKLNLEQSYKDIFLNTLPLPMDRPLTLSKLLLLILVILPANIYAAMEVNPGATDMHYGQWPGAGDLDDNQDLCVVATQGAGPPTKKNKKAAKAYRVKGKGLGVPGDLFRVYEILAGIDFIAYRAFYNAKAGPGGVELIPTINTGKQKKSSAKIPCKKATGNFQILFEEVGVEGLAAANPGYYTGQFWHRFKNVDTGEVFIDTFDLSVSIGRLVRIFSLNDLALTPGVPYSGLEAFCVYDNDLGGAGYSITASSANAGGGLFRLHINVATIDYYTPYNLWYDDSAAASAASTPLTTGVPSSPFIGSALLNCGALDNASIYIETAGPFSQVGVYSDVITLLIQPN